MLFANTDVYSYKMQVAYEDTEAQRGRKANENKKYACLDKGKNNPHTDRDTFTIVYLYRKLNG